MGERPSGPAQVAATARSPSPSASAVSTPTASSTGTRSERSASITEASDVDGAGTGCAGGGQRLEEAVVERAELEEVEELADLVEVVVTEDELVEVDVEGNVADQQHDVDVAAHVGLGRPEVLPQLRRLLGEVLEDPVDAAVRRDELGRRLLADAGDAGEVVGGVAAQGGVLEVLGRRDAGALLDAGLVVEGVVGHPASVVEDPDVRVLDELVAVTVAGDDEDVVTAIAGLGGERGDDVVGLEARRLEHRDVEDLDHLADQADLLAEDVGCLAPVGLVGGQRLVAEGRLGPVERDREMVGLVVADQVHQHRGEAEDGVRHLPRRRGEVGGQGEEGTVGQRVAVDQHQRAHDDAPITRRVGPARRR